MELKSILEAILFSAQKPQTAQELKSLLAAAADQSDAPGPKGVKKNPGQKHPSRSGGIGARTCRSPAQLPAHLRSRRLAVCQPARIRPLAAGVAGTESPSASAVAAGF